VIFFPGPQTVTGEDVLELHVHGGPAVVKAVLGAVGAVGAMPKFANSGSIIRYAESGEFTRRAFLNDRLDLPQIEALGNTLAADTEQQRRLAVRGTNDTLSARYELWRRQLLYARGELEALIDFSEDQHFDESVDDFVTSIMDQVRNLLRRINLHIENSSKGELLRNGIKVALLGAPNAGKSSLLNRIVGREAAIVSSEEGTTRDIVDVGIDLGGWFCKLGDMAGLRSETGSRNDNPGHGQLAIGEVEKEGIRRAKARALESDVVIVVFSLEEGEDGGDPRLLVEPEVVEAVQSLLELQKNVIVAINKTDKLSSGDHQAKEITSANYVQEACAIIPGLAHDRIFPISCKEAQNEQSKKRDPGNIQVLLDGIIRTFERITTPSELQTSDDKHEISYWPDSLGVTHRQSANLQSCAQHLNDFLSQISQTPVNADESETVVDIVTAAEHLRFAADCLAKITGRGESGDVEQVLGVVFEK
jgi:tRNA modification GTPase